jgi:hypothetical protein
MNKFMNYFADYFVRKDITQYPELYQKQHQPFDLTIAMSNGVMYHDGRDVPRPLDWKSF